MRQQSNTPYINFAVNCLKTLAPKVKQSVNLIVIARRYQPKLKV